VAAPPVAADELMRFESTFNRARLGGAAITIFLGPLFPNIGIVHVGLFAALLLGHAAFVTFLLRSGRFRRRPEALSRLTFSIDLLAVAYAILVFSADPNWTTYIIGILIVITGGFRFSTAGAFVSAIGMAAAYVGVAFFRARMFGFATEPYRLAFTVTVYFLAAFLMAGLVRELANLRAQRVAFEHQRAETEALRQLDQMKSEFLAAMSHDFRSPLTVVRGSIEILMSQRPGALTAAQSELASRAARNVHRLEEFSEDLLEMARIEHGGVELERVEIDACEIVGEVVEDHRVFAHDREQTLDFERPRDPVTISVDVGRLRRAIGNLLSNAIKFAPASSTIRVRAGPDAGGFRLTVTDHGPGVDPDERERIFEKFSRGRRSATTAGAGLGLSIARSLVELHGGTLRYEDAAGGGATFVLSVPAGLE
jgi:signal transduction histidine kinase